MKWFCKKCQEKEEKIKLLYEWHKDTHG
jgi:hypothetical protein